MIIFFYLKAVVILALNRSALTPRLGVTRCPRALAPCSRPRYAAEPMFCSVRDYIAPAARVTREKLPSTNHGQALGRGDESPPLRSTASGGAGIQWTRTPALAGIWQSAADRRPAPPAALCGEAIEAAELFMRGPLTMADQPAQAVGAPLICAQRIGASQAP